MFLDDDLEQRFEDKFSRSDNCWEWSGAKNPKGYGKMKVGALRPICIEHGNGYVSFWELIGREFGTRYDSSKSETHIEITDDDKKRNPDQMKYEFEDGIFSFHTAHFGSMFNDVRIVFRVREDNAPRQRAKEKDIRGYDRIFPATDYEIERWIENHP